MSSSGYAAVRAVLTDPAFLVPTPQPPDAPSGVAWLRANVARFSSGPAHARRRAMVEDQLSTMDCQVLRGTARSRTITTLAAAEGAPIDLMAAVARVLPTELLAEALGLTGVRPATVAAIARAYPTGAPDEDADRAVGELITACGGAADEATAARIGLLAQAHDATAGLIGNAAFIMLRGALPDPAEAILAETLRHSPPVRATKRTDATGTLVDLDLAAANRDLAVFADPDRFDPRRENSSAHLDFGFGQHACPGHHHATQIAAGILDAVRGCRLLTENLRYSPSANLRIPAELVITRPA